MTKNHKSAVKSLSFIKGWATACLGLCALVSHAGAATFSIEPPQVTTEYQGKVTLQIGGVGTDDRVIVEKFFDLNGNGTVDAGEPLTMKVSLEDNESVIVGGVVNSHIPQDSNETAGAITAEISLHELDRFAGSQILRVSSASSSFAEVAAILTVAAPSYPQSVSGVVRSGGTPLAHAHVALLGGDGDVLVAGALAGADGSFTLGAPPGDYVVVAVKPGYIVTEFAQVTLPAEANASQDVELDPTTRLISGSLSDADTGEKLAGNIIFLDSDAGFTFTYTDAEGNFEAGVIPTVWELEAGAETLARQGYMGAEGEVSTQAGDATGVSLEAAKATSLIYGHLTYEDGTPLSGIEIYASNNSGQETFTYTDAEGFYLLGVSSGQWWVGADQETLASRGLGVQSGSVTLSNGQALEFGMEVVELTSNIHGRVVDQQGNPMTFIGVHGSNWENGGSTYTETDEEGYFSLGAFGGPWQLGVDSFDLADLGFVGPNLMVEVLDGVDISGLVLVVRAVTGSISGRIESNDGAPVAFLNVYAYMISGDTNYYASGITDSTGQYSIEVVDGTWTLYLSSEDLAELGFATPPSQQAQVSGPATVNFTLIPSVPLEILTTVLPEGTVGLQYAQSIAASGGIPPYFFSLAPGSDPLPPGLDFSWEPGTGDNSHLTGTPQTAGTFTFIVQVSDNQGNRGEQQLTLTVAEGVSEPPQFGQITKIPGGKVGIRMTGQEGKSYRIETTDSLGNFSWQPMDTIIAGTGGEIYVEDSTSGQSVRFYRSVEIQ